MTGDVRHDRDPVGLGQRAAAVARLATTRFDVLIVGGGISGAGIALDLSARGLRVGLVEQHDFAGGTSSRSSKLIHGGLRYLAQLQVNVTREALHERSLLLRLAPALVEPLPFVIPVTAGLLEAARVAIGLSLYDWLAGRENTRHFAAIRRVDLAALAPGIDTRAMTAAFVYHDCRTDDARLTLRVLAAAVARGAVAANRLAVRAVRHRDGHARGVEAIDLLDGRPVAIDAGCVVLATGPWGDRSLAGEGAAAARVRPSKGVHLFLSAERLPVRVALYLPTGVDDRLVFVVPWLGHVLVGTTDTEYRGSLDAPAVERADVEYLLAVLNRAFPGRRYTAEDVRGAQAGIRPLVDDGDAASTRVSREERVWTRPDGAIVLAGGKLTTYRRTAEKVAEAVRAQVGGAGGHPTAEIPIAPLVDDPALIARLAAVGLAPPSIAHLLRQHGAAAERLVEIVRANPSLAHWLVPGHPIVRAEVVDAARHEQASTVEDVLARRTRLILVDHAGALAAAADVATLLAGELGWSDDARRAALAAFAGDAEQYRPPGPAAAPAAAAT